MLINVKFSIENDWNEFSFPFFSLFGGAVLAGAAVKMEHFQAALDPRKQELLEARFLGARVSDYTQFSIIYFGYNVVMKQSDDGNDAWAT